MQFISQAWKTPPNFTDVVVKQWFIRASSYLGHKGIDECGPSILNLGLNLTDLM